MSRELRATFSDAEYEEIADWIAAQRKWAKHSHFVRYAIYSIIKKNRTGAHHATTGKPAGRPKTARVDAPESPRTAPNTKNDKNYDLSIQNPGAGQRPGLQAVLEQGNSL